MKKNFRYFAGLLGLSMLLTLSVSCREIKKGDYSMNEKLNVKDSSSEKTIQEAIAQETKKIDRFDSIPLEYQRKVENGGTIEHISYPTKDYYGDQAEITKFANEHGLTYKELNAVFEEYEFDGILNNDSIKNLIHKEMGFLELSKVVKEIKLFIIETSDKYSLEMAG